MLRLWSMLIALTLTLGLASCERAAPSKGPERPDPDEVRLVALSPALGLMLRDLGLEDRVVGVHDFDHALSDSIPRVGSLNGIDYEALLSVRPTHVLVEIASHREAPERLLTLGEAHGWEVRRIDSIRTVDDIARVIDDLYLSFVSPPEAGAVNAIGFSDPSERFDKRMPSEAFAQAIAARGPAVEGAGRVLLLGATTPPSALGPGSFHAQILERLGGANAITEGGMWQELDAEDVLRLSPDGIVLVMPRDRTEADRFGAPERAPASEVIRRLGVVGELPIPAIRQGRVALIDESDALVPAASSMGRFAERLAEILERWTHVRAQAAP
ncbi:MAG: ABC transporter substrate-binding protein [Phycisphaerales bacterium JB059]